eukprot:2574154-Pleurochrysis_carterae.AAC.2
MRYKLSEGHRSDDDAASAISANGGASSVLDTVFCAKSGCAIMNGEREGNGGDGASGGNGGGAVVARRAGEERAANWDQQLLAPLEVRARKPARHKCTQF